MKYILFSLLLLMGAQTVFAADPDTELTLLLPPDSLGKWYKPANERDVWLHTMFRLRREMQAVSEYAALEKPGLLKKWLDGLQKDYLSIGDMVPEWADELETELLEKMQLAAGKGEFEKLQSLQNKLGKACQSCHVDYKLTAALRFRAPDFSAVMVESEETMEEEKYSRVMSRLTLLVNRIKIAVDDDRTDTAMTTLEALQLRLADLGGSCSSCHKTDAQRERILGKNTRDFLAQLKAGIDTKDKKKAGRYMGEFAVAVCAECHAIHRLQSDMRRLLTSD